MDAGENMKTEMTEEEGKQEGTSAQVELVRVMDRTIHVSSLDRKKEVDYTVRNNSDEELNYLFLPLRRFEVNLQVYNEEGTLLNYYPNNEVEEILEQAKKGNEAGYQPLEKRFEHAGYRLYIQLPPERPLAPGELRTIQLTFEQSDPVEFYSIRDPSIFKGWISEWKRKFFKIPTFIANVERFPGAPHDEFIVVIGAPGYAASGEAGVMGSQPTREIYKNNFDDGSRVLSVRLPEADEGRYTLDLQYDLIPNNHSLMLGLTVYWVIAVALGLGSFLLAALATFNHTFGLSDIGTTVSAGLITSTIGLIFALNVDWTDRYRLLSVLPLLLHGMAWVLWSIRGS